MTIKNVLIKDLTPYAKNAKKHDNDQVKQVANSIEQFGMVQPIVADKNNNIVIGHCRLMACKKLKMKEVPVLYVEDLTKEQIDALRLADNKTNESEWDFDLLGDSLNEVLNIDMSDFGFDLSEHEEEKEIIEDEVPEVSDLPPIAKIGDIWQLGRHRLMCGDSTDEKETKKLIEDKMADLILIDPPYNMNYRGTGTHNVKRIKNDNMSEEDFCIFLEKIWNSIFKITRDGASGYCFYKEMGHGSFLKSLNNSEFKFKQQCVWVKNHHVLGSAKYQGKHEPFLMFCKKRIEKWKGGRNQTSVIEDIELMEKEELIEVIKEIRSNNEVMDVDLIFEKKLIKSELHPTMKPIKLLAKLLRNSSEKNDIVLDVFGGSGSTLIACEQTERICYMMELDPKYVDVIIKRWENLTGQKACLINGCENI